MDIQELSELIESFDLIEDFLYTSQEKELIEDCYTFPFKYKGLKKLDELQFSYLSEYKNDPDNMERLIPFDEFSEFLDEIKDIVLYEDQNVLPEYSPETLLENGFYQSEFVIHEHNATSFHWDFRFKTRFGNSAYSFAIPKAKLPENEDDKVLAIRQPMHPAVWVDLKSTDTFRDEPEGRSAKTAMGSIRLIDRGTVFVKERPRSFAVYIQGEKIVGAYMLVKVGNGNSYLFVKASNILSDKDARQKEWRGNAYKYWKFQTKELLRIFGIDCSKTKLVFENEDGTMTDNSENEEIENPYYFISVPIEAHLSERHKANPERITEQCEADEIGYKLGLFIWFTQMNDDQRNDAYGALKKIDFMTAWLKETNNYGKPNIFSEAISSIVTGRRMFKTTNLEIILKPILLNKL